MQSPGGNNPGDVPSRLPNRCSTLSLSQDAPKELGKARWEAVSQGSGTARGIGCRTLLLSPSKALSCAGGSRETGKGECRAIGRSLFTCWGERLRPVSRGPPLA